MGVAGEERERGLGAGRVGAGGVLIVLGGFDDASPGVVCGRRTRRDDERVRRIGRIRIMFLLFK
jgi:hypothetical protein